MQYHYYYARVKNLTFLVCWTFEGYIFRKPFRFVSSVLVETTLPSCESDCLFLLTLSLPYVLMPWIEHSVCDLVEGVCSEHLWVACRNF